MSTRMMRVCLTRKLEVQPNRASLFSIRELEQQAQAPAERLELVSARGWHPLHSVSSISGRVLRGRYFIRFSSCSGSLVVSAGVLEAGCYQTSHPINSC